MTLFSSSVKYGFPTQKPLSISVKIYLDIFTELCIQALIMFNLGELNSSNNLLLDYLKKQSPETLATVAQSVTPEAQQIINQNIQNLLGMLPPPHFNVSITTDRENLAGLIGSAMMTGYFIRQMETRMQLDHSLSSVSSPE